MEFLKVALGKQIRKYRKKKGMTQEDLALVCGIDSANVSRWESGKHFPDDDKLQTILDALEISEEQLFAFSEPEPPKSIQVLAREIDILEQKLKALELSDNEKRIIDVCRQYDGLRRGIEILAGLYKDDLPDAEVKELTPLKEAAKYLKQNKSS